MNPTTELTRKKMVLKEAVIMPGDVAQLIEKILTHQDYSESKIAEKIGVNKYTIQRLRKSKMQDRLGRITSRLIGLYCKLSYPSDETY